MQLNVNFNELQFKLITSSSSYSTYTFGFYWLLSWYKEYNIYETTTNYNKYLSFDSQLFTQSTNIVFILFYLYF